MTPARALALPRDLAYRVGDADFARLLGYPKARLPEGRVAGLAAAARDWYAHNAAPWAFIRTIELESLERDEIVLRNSRRFLSEILAERLRRGGAEGIIIAAVSAGSEIDRRSEKLWSLERPDEAYFIDRFGAAVVEHLATWVVDQLRVTLAAEDLSVLPGYSPGYDGWEMAEQTIVAESLLGDGTELPPGPFEVLSSGMIRPKNSLLSVFGLTRDGEAAAEAWSRHRCSWCSFSPCSHRRARFAGNRGAA